MKFPGSVDGYSTRVFHGGNVTRINRPPTFTGAASLQVNARGSLGRILSFKSPDSRRLAGILLILATLVMTLVSAFSATAANAATECTPDAKTGCVQGIIKTSAGDAAAGVGIELTGGSADAQTTTTDAEGRWVFAATKAGPYTVSVDEATLPEGQFFKQTGSRDIQVQLYENSSVLFPLTDDPAAAQKEPAEEESEAPATTTPADQSTDTSDASTSASSAGGDGFSWSRFWQQFASGIRMGLLLSLGALGLSLVFGTTGISNFAHAEMLTLGGMLGYLFMSLTGNIWVAGLITVVLMAAFGYLQDLAMWKPLRKKRLSLMQLMIVSIGFSIALQNLFQFFFGASILRIDTRTPETVTILGVTLTVQSYVAMGIAILAIVGVGVAMKFSRFGRATRAVADNPALAEASGINVDQVIRVVWTVGTSLAGLAGVLLGLVLNGVAWNTGWSFLLLMFAAVVLGGIGTAFGAFVGAMIIGLVVEMANIWLPGDLKHAAALFILIIVLLVRPQGLFGRKERIG